MTGFEAFPKIPRLNRAVVATEKIDGTNAQVFITDEDLDLDSGYVTEVNGLKVVAGSRKRFISIYDDNFGWAGFVTKNAGDLADALGPGRHFGEWWGSGIQRSYGFRGGMKERFFSLFNADRWVDVELPDQVRTVPVLVRDSTDMWAAAEAALDLLASQGSKAAPGFHDPEGVVVFHTASRSMFKATLLNDELPKELVTS